MLDDQRLARPDERSRRSDTSPAVALAAAIGAGLVIGPLDLVLQRALPYPWANLANSSAVWAVLAFVVGWWWGGRSRWQPAVIAVIALLIAVETYYVAAVLLLGDDLATLYNDAARMWWVLAVGAGVVFGTAGAWARHGGPWRGAIGTALGAAVLFAEAGLDLFRAAQADPQRATDLQQTALILAGCGILLLVVAGRGAGQRVRAAALAVALTGLGFAAFVLIGFG